MLVAHDELVRGELAVGKCVEHAGREMVAHARNSLGVTFSLQRLRAAQCVHVQCAT